MSDISNSMYGPLYYDPTWLLLGLLFLLMAVAIIVLIIYFTRKKEVKTLKSLKVTQAKPIDMEALKRKYIGLIDQAERDFNNHKIKSSVAHQHFSIIVRLFYAEGLGFHADILTLTDLKRTNYTMLIDTIEDLYPDEFDTLEKGSVATAAENARRLVRNQ
ncbi:hypothetical protein J5500_03975 [Candidatus Saccharibacteria bacterium]|nr:hypothetical protein [Candidatus Saccharibacteria bacterium]